MTDLVKKVSKEIMEEVEDIVRLLIRFRITLLLLAQEAGLDISIPSKFLDHFLATVIHFLT